MRAHLQLWMVAAVLHLSLAHTWMTSPKAYNRVYKARDCVGRQCTDACPSKWAHGMNNSVDSPAATWRRGQTVRVSWVRNNHHGGMFRLALVPVKLMWDRAAHKRFTLLHGCWASGRYRCSKGEDCGTDQSGDAFARRVKIPSVFPDGDYVMGFVWYGGLYKTSRKGFFPDFYSCSHVRISGGKKLGGVYQSFFKAGNGARKAIKFGKCRTSADRIGQCERTGCPKKKSFRAIPRVFQNRKMPEVITPDAVKRASTPINNKMRDIAALGVSSSDFGNVERGICSGRICCKASCGKCGGAGCQNRDGGGDGCCMGQILKAKKQCGAMVGAPCVRW